MHSADVEGEMSMGIRLLYAPSFSSALIRPYGMADHSRAGSVRLIFALARNAELQQQRRERREEQHQDPDEPAAFAVVAIAAQPPKIIPSGPCARPT